MASLNTCAASNASSGNEVFFYSENAWYLGSGSDTLLGGPFSKFDDLLEWAVEKEFVEPKSLYPVIDEREVHAPGTH